MPLVTASRRSSRHAPRGAWWLQVLGLQHVAGGRRCQAARGGALRLESLEQRLAMAVYSVQMPTALFGTLDQHDLSASYAQFGSGAASKACGPTAGLNSLVYLQNAFGSSYGNSLVTPTTSDLDRNGIVNAYDSWVFTAGSELAATTTMNTTLTNGTWHDNFIQGLARYAEARAPGRTQYLAQDYWAPTYWGNAPATKTQPDWVQGQTPTWSFLYDSLAKSAAVNVLFSANVGTSGHYVTVTGLTWDTSTNAGTLAYVNPWTGGFEQTGIRLNGSGRLSTDYFGTNGSWIGLAEALVPLRAVPENSPAGTTVTMFAQTDASTTYSLVAAPSVANQATAWMPMSNFLTYCRSQDASRAFPLTIEGRVNPQNGAWECRGVFRPWVPSGVYYWYEFGRTKQQTDAIDARRKAEGYSILSQQTFLAAGNVPTYQTVWVREGLATARRDLAALQSPAPNDNAAFTMVAGQLKTAFAFDFEAKSSYSILVRATQPNGSYRDQPLTISVSNVNERPVVAGVATSGLSYASRSGAVRLAASATVTDVDSRVFAGGVLNVAIAAGGLSTDRLTISAQGTGPGQLGLSGTTITYGGVAIGSWAGGTGTMPLKVTFNSAATVPAVQALLRSIAYGSTATDPTAGGTATTRSIRTTLSDGPTALGGLATTLSQTLSVRA
jgi:hypothetical protein